MTIHGLDAIVCAAKHSLTVLHCGEEMPASLALDLWDGSTEDFTLEIDECWIEMCAGEFIQ